MTHTYLHGATFECETCGDEYEDHPLAFSPHLCPPCEDVEGEDRFADVDAPCTTSAQPATPGKTEP